MKKTIYFTQIFFMLFLSHTLSTNQTAELIDKNFYEISGGISNNLTIGEVSPVSKFLFMKYYMFLESYTFDIYFMYREGLNKNTEYQFKSGGKLIFEFIYPQCEFYLENYFKIGLYKSIKSDISILPFIGLFGGYEGTYRYSSIGSYLGVSTGFKLIVDIDYSKYYDRNRMYLGFPFLIKYNVIDINQYLDFGYGRLRRTLPYFESGFSLGFQYLRNKKVMRNEFFIYYGFEYYARYNGRLGESIFIKEWESWYVTNVIIMGYSFNIGIESHRKNK